MPRRGRLDERKPAPQRKPEQRPENGASPEQPNERVLALQRTAGNTAVTGMIQRGVVEWLKETVGGEESNAEITLTEMNEQLDGVIENLDRAKLAAEVAGVDQFVEGLGGVSEGLGKVKGGIGKVLGAQETAREVRQFYRALKKLQTLDLNKDYKEGADAMSDLAEAAGKLGGKLLPEQAGAVGAYLQIIEKSGAIFKMGARLRAKTELKIDPEAYHRELEKEIAAIPTPPKASASETVKLEDMGNFISSTVAKATSEGMAKSGFWGWAGWGIYERDFLRAYAEFMKLHKEQEDIGMLGRLGSEYRSLKIRKREPWDKGQEQLLLLERWCGKIPETSVSFIPCIKTWESVRPY